MDWVVTIIFKILFWVDSIIYGFISAMYNLLMEISELTIFSPKTINDFGKNIYVLLGIFMLFKVSFSLLTYVVNPDSFSDKEKGVNKLITNVLTVMVLIVITPWIFTEAMNIQVLILQDNVIGNLVFGMKEKSGNFKQNAGKQMAYTTFSAFFHVNTDNYPNCDVISGSYDEYTESEAKNRAGKCATDIKTENYNKLPGIEDFDKDLKNDSRDKYEKLFKASSLINKTGTGDKNIIEYTPLISTAAGVVILLVLITFCFDVAVRSVKLGFLQLIAPVPIISRIDPKSAKNGMFSKWVKVCVSTYASLFIRLLAIYFAVFIISEIATGGLRNVVDPGTKISLLAKVFIILGALMFAKEIPKLLEELIPGLKLGEFSLNPMKKLGQSPFAAAAVGGVAGFAGGMAANTFGAISNVQKKFKDDKDMTMSKALFGKDNFFGGQRGLKGINEGRKSLKNFRHNTYGSILAGGTSSAFRAARSGLTGGGKQGIGNLVSSSMKSSSQARNQRDIGYSSKSKAIDNFRDLSGIKNTYGTTNKIKGDIKGYGQELENVKQQEQAILQQQSYIASQNPDLSLAYREANRVIWNPDKPGESDYAYSSYEQYAQEHAESINKARLESNNAELERLEAIGVLEKKEFDRMRALDLEKEKYDKRGKDLEKKIKSLEEDMYKAGKKD